MALWTDGDFITAADLVSLDGEVAQVASAENITLDDAAGAAILHRATEDAGSLIMSYMQQFGGYLSSQSVSGNHYAAVMNVGLPSVNRAKILLSQVVVSTQIATEWSTLKQWAAHMALASFYRDASHRTQNDRYAEKAKSYRTLAQGSNWPRLVAQGLPIVRNPLPCPGAVFEPGAGKWGTSNVISTSTPGAFGGSFDVAITWVTQSTAGWVSPARKQNSESGPAARVQATVASNRTLQVSIAGLTPPNGAQPESTVSTALVSYGAATGWLVYAGARDGTLYLQTASPLPLTTTSYTFATDPVLSGYQIGTGQYPDLFYSLSTVVQRG